MEPEETPLLGNDSINKFRRQRTRNATMEELLEAVLSMRPCRGYIARAVAENLANT
jgi:hypothetical protein